MHAFVTKPTSKILAVSTIVASMFSTASAFDIKYNGWLEAFGKGGFNNQAIDADKGVYPTDSFLNVVGSLGFDGNLLPKDTENQSLKYGFNVTGGSMILDSTSKGFPLGPDSVNNEYVGNWAGYNQNLGPKDGTNRHLYVVNNAYLDYTYGDFDTSPFSFQFKGGRYLSSAEYMSGYTQGFEAAMKFKFSDSQSLKLWWYSSYGRAFAFGQWLIDFYSPQGYMTSGGQFANYGIHAFKAIYSLGGLDITPYIYFSPGTYTAPAFRVEYDTNKGFDGTGFRSRTFANILLPIYGDDTWVGKYRWGSIVDKYTQSLLIQQQFDYNNYNFGLGLYKNFGHANARIGTTGNPWMIDFWTASSYDIGRSISDMIGKDAITPYLFVGGTHFANKLWWQILGRWTDAERSQEHSVALNLKYQIDERLSIGGKIEYFSDTTKAGYKVGWANESGSNGNTAPQSGTPKNVADRSHAFLWIHYDI
ncbi:outer membrane family protein [Helicobacter zhangjianzhongii]|uniref:Outer membrane family protein n=1 Tax=Helicobacter zhangjianzhongii TaxID=2974574 RepID=A0ACC6FW02_9HELI|nr:MULTISPECIES: outer membrane family protein [unclassified Helicobacter]MDL0080504.1 outer membrane family protein [Helicobacter sp. CPD2-1]MDL0083018.1 outer membrane family protein [Helicobacter sp. XJK30-2]